MFLKNSGEVYKEFVRDTRDIERKYSLNGSVRLKVIDALRVALSMHVHKLYSYGHIRKTKAVVDTSPTTKNNAILNPKINIQKCKYSCKIVDLVHT
jgi:hypothetical protein